MTVKRIVADLPAANPAAARKFYEELLGLETVMDQGWVMTFAAPGQGPLQLTLASEGGAGAPLPAISVEVDDVDEIYQQARAMEVEIVREIVDEPWGVRRFFARDPAGNLVNILSHKSG